MVRLLLILAVLLTASCSDPRSQVTASPKNEISCTDMTFEGDGTPEEVRAAVPEDGWRGELAFSSCRERVSTPPRWGCALPEEDVANDLKMTSFIWHMVDEGTMVMARAACQESEGARWVDNSDAPHW